MKKKLAFLFSFVALVAFITVNVANAQSPQTDKPTAKTEQAVDKKADGCCTSKAATTATTAKSGCCTSQAKAEAAEAQGAAKSGCATSGKTCGGCSSKTGTQTAEEAPVPRR